MVDESLIPESAPDYTQLTQARVPLELAADAFATRDANGRIPIIIVPQRLNRVRNELVITSVLLFAGAIVIGYFVSNIALISLTIALGVICLILGLYQSFIVRIPEGATALLTKGGRFTRAIGSGTTILPPWILVSHLVTTREIPFDVPIVEASTKDNVRANVDTLITFRITDAYKFVYNISASDFDQVFQAACQDGLRSMMRQVTSEQVVDLKKQDLAYMVESLSTAVAPYGVTITGINVTFAQPQAEFMQSLEARQLSILQQSEQKERQALAQRRQADVEILARQQVMAQVAQEKETLELEYMKAEAHHRLVEMEAAAEELRLQKLEERIKKYPVAAAYDVGSAKLDVARALAGNTRAMLQVGSADDIVKAYMMRDVLQDIPFPSNDNGGESPASEPPPPPPKKTTKRTEAG
ncbi:MAG: SPFH/Band 7/PHB domain protein [Anaerolineae bacterium]|nr:SPFH/Band 7/PHB domain protein [Anaerolineae bacterium]